MGVGALLSPDVLYCRSGCKGVLWVVNLLLDAQGAVQCAHSYCSNVGDIISSFVVFMPSVMDHSRIVFMQTPTALLTSKLQQPLALQHIAYVQLSSDVRGP